MKFELELKDGNLFPIASSLVSLDETNVNVLGFVKDSHSVLFEADKSYLNTLLDLTRVVPYVLLYFEKVDDEILFTGAGFSLNSKHPPFMIQTQADYILLHRFPFPFDLNKIRKLRL